MTFTPIFGHRRSGRKSIDQVPKNVAQFRAVWQSKKRAKTFDRKVRVGDWEGDLIGGEDNCQTIVSLVDRKSRLTLLHKVSGKTEQEVSAALIFRLQEDEGCVKTITFDVPVHRSWATLGHGQSLSRGE